MTQNKGLSLTETYIERRKTKREREKYEERERVRLLTLVMTRSNVVIANSTEKVNIIGIVISFTSWKLPSKEAIQSKLLYRCP